MKVFEKVAVLSVMLGLLLRILLIPIGSDVIFYGLLAVTFLYFYFGFVLLNEVRIKDVFKKSTYAKIPSWHMVGGIACGLALSMVSVGVLFKLRGWFGAETNLIPGLISLIVITVISIVKRKGNHPEFYGRVLSRTIVAIVFCILFLLIPRYTFLKIFYRDKPGVIEAIDNSIKDPTNPELNKKVSEELKKLHG